MPFKEFLRYSTAKSQSEVQSKSHQNWKINFWIHQWKLFPVLDKHLELLFLEFFCRIFFRLKDMACWKLLNLCQKNGLSTLHIFLHAQVGGDIPPFIFQISCVPSSYEVKLCADNKSENRFPLRQVLRLLLKLLWSNVFTHFCTKTNLGVEKSKSFFER